MKSIFEYSGFRDYLRDFYAQKKKNGRFSYREFSRSAGFSSPNFVKLVIDGVSRVSPQSCAKLCRACGLKGRDKAYFKKLVRLDQGKTIDDKMSALAAMQDLREFLPINNVKENQSAFYGAWYHAVVREIISMHGRADASEIARMIMPALKEKQVCESIELLKSLGLIEQDAQGRYRPANAFISSGADVPSAAVRNYQREMGLLGIDALYTLGKDEREISGATLCVSEKTALKLKEKIQKLRREALRMAQDDFAPQRVYRLNLQLFPVSKSAGCSPDSASSAQKGLI